MDDQAERIQGLLTALGPADDEIEAITRDGDARWSVVFDADTIVALDLVANEAKLVLSIPLGRPPTEQRLAAYEAMLCYAMLWPETGGVRVGLGGPHGELVQLVDLATGGLTADMLGTVLRNVAAKAGMWRRVIADGSFAETTSTFEDRREILIRA